MVRVCVCVVCVCVGGGGVLVPCITVNFTTHPLCSHGADSLWWCLDYMYRAVWPQLKVLSNGVLMLTAGRPGIGLWISPSADGTVLVFLQKSALEECYWVVTMLLRLKPGHTRDAIACPSGVHLLTTWL
jgi:hypothetical protein